MIQALLLGLGSLYVPKEPMPDVVIYGGTSAGVIAACQVQRMGGTALLVDPDGRLGGLSSGGLGATDIGHKDAIGGLSREFYRRVSRHYHRPEAWRHERAEAYRGGARASDGEVMWAFEPHVAEQVFEGFIEEYGVTVLRGERLDRSPGGIGLATVEGGEGRTIQWIKTESGRRIEGRVFMDATYEGDLMALAGVSYTVGREGEAEFGESLAGVRTALARHHQLAPGVDPWVRPGDPTSGLLPEVGLEGPRVDGEGDRNVQAYCLRLCFTDHPENRLPIVEPKGYDAARYELLLRNFEAGADRAPWSPIGMPNRKTDINNNRGVSLDWIGHSEPWAEVSYEERAELYRAHRRWTEGLLWTLISSDRVPAEIRAEIGRWGPAKDEFVETGGYSPQLYVREARRMRGTLVMTEHHCRSAEVATSPVGLAAYTMDSHNVRRYVDASGQVRNEGDVQVRVPRPFRIGYDALTPVRAECENLLVVCCPSATHVAFGSIRMEPVFMILAQSAATAAVQAVRSECGVQAVDRGRLEERLLADGQVLVPPPVRRGPKGRALESLGSIVVDEEAAERAGFETLSRSAAGWFGTGYRHDGNDRKGAQSVRYRFQVSEAGRYEVRVAWTASGNRASAVPVKVRAGEVLERFELDQRRAPAQGAYQVLGAWELEPGEVVVELSNRGTDGYVIADAVALEPARD
jgi:hypothetical protein